MAAVSYDVLAEHDTRLWIAAFILYGIGDTVTTMWGLSTGGVAEAGPIAAPLIASYGPYVLLVVKAATFIVFYGIWRVLRTPGRIAVPLALAAVGGIVTAWNLTVIATAI